MAVWLRGAWEGKLIWETTEEDGANVGRDWGERSWHRGKMLD